MTAGAASLGILLGFAPQPRQGYPAITVPEASEYPSCGRSADNRRMDVSLLFPLGWQHYLIGGLCIGAAVALLYLFTGWIGGMSSVFSSTWSYLVQRPYFQQPRYTGTRVWRLVYAAGLVLGAGVWWLFWGEGEALTTGVPVWQLLIGGFLVGYGARLGNGCTSGHGICGLGSLKKPSLYAVLTFMATAFITANLVAWVYA